MLAVFGKKFGRKALAVLALLTSLGVIVTAQGAAAHASRNRRAASLPALARTLPAAMRKSGHWMKLHGKRVWGVPLVLQMSHRRIVAHIASNSTHKNLGSGLCISSYPNTKAHEVDQYGCNGSANQHWIYYIGTEEMPYLAAAGSGAANLCLNNYGGGFSDGNKQALWPCSSSSYAMWYGVGVSNFSGYLLVHLLKDIGKWSSMCLTTLGNKSDGSPIREWTCNRGSRNQAFGGDWNPNTP